MAYSFKIKMGPLSNKWKGSPTKSLIEIIKLHTHLNLTEARQLVERIADGQQVEFALRDKSDVEAAFFFSQQVRSMGFSSSVEYRVHGADLPYLVNSNGKFQDSEKVTERELSAKDIEQLMSIPSTQLVVTGYGNKIEWIPEKEKYKYWKQNVKPQLIDYQNSQKRNDYPLYTATEWIAKSGKTYIFLWTLH